jgi:pimeloyl-ACP methyl ester carboxylesterase/predicted amino acid-binding ACT domain protein
MPRRPSLALSSKHFPLLRGRARRAPVPPVEPVQPKEHLQLGEPAEGHLTWHRIEVDGRPANYGVGGSSGPSVVFLHGWALGSRAYKRAINRLISRGCRVYAPSLPSFGGTADLPAREMSLDGYAQWVAAFMKKVGIDEPVLLIGHSFGGGVAITLAERHSEFVSYLVLLNAIGGVSPRPLWAWLAGLGRELWPVPEATEMFLAMRDDLVPNVIRNPLGMARAGRAAQGADLRDELSSLRARGTPVLLLTSESDSIIPRTAFESLCDAVGADGRVVQGGHSWLLADPDSFDEVLGAIVDVQVAEHRTARAPGRAAEVRRLLRGTRVPERTARAMLRKGPPLWLMSESAAVLARDVALCHPKLAGGEVRATALPMEGTRSVRLSIVARDRRGLLADSAAVLAANGLSITRASAATWPRQHVALHSFVVENGATLDEDAWRSIGDSLRTMVAEGAPPPISVQPVGPVKVEIHGSGGGRSLVEVTAQDQVGLLSTLCRWIADLGADIESLHARTIRRVAHDTFLVAGDVDESLVSRRASRATDIPGAAKTTSDV